MEVITIWNDGKKRRMKREREKKNHVNTNKQWEWGQVNWSKYLSAQEDKNGGNTYMDCREKRPRKRKERTAREKVEERERGEKK